MSEIIYMAVPLLAGVALGVLFFGGLWWTVQKGVVSTRPALWFMGSLLLRTGVALAGFYFVMGSDWRLLAVCMAGFVIARLIVTRLPAIRRVSHAP